MSENRRSQILKLVKAKPGIRRKAICEEMGIDVKSNKAQSVSVALTKLVQDGEIRRDGSRAYYPTR
ncbi:MAG: MarR family transcriptional regulator [Gammaproteobacteria bacterium]|nr:MarR family transcriptional regulator [Gammaproteobacteria bacterium]